MEAVGVEVIIVLLPLFAGLVALCYYNWRSIVVNLSILMGRDQPVPQQPAQVHPLFGEGECAICLDQPKKLQVSATCGHSYCGGCLMDIFDRDRTIKISCPLCRKQVTTIFKWHWPDGGDPVQKQRVIHLVQQYNNRFDDNRPFARRILEFPYVFKRAVRYLLNPLFWALFLRSFYFFRTVMFIVVYILLPFDLLPERLLGIFGFFDDIFIFFMLMAFGISLFALVFLRMGHH